MDSFRVQNGYSKKVGKFFQFQHNKAQDTPASLFAADPIKLPDLKTNRPQESSFLTKLVALQDSEISPKDLAPNSNGVEVA